MASKLPCSFFTSSACIFSDLDMKPVPKLHLSGPVEPRYLVDHRANMKYICQYCQIHISYIVTSGFRRSVAKQNPSTEQRRATRMTECDKHDFPFGCFTLFSFFQFPGWCWRGLWAISQVSPSRFDDLSTCIPRSQTSQTLRSCGVAADLWSAGESNPSGDAKQNSCPGCLQCWCWR